MVKNIVGRKVGVLDGLGIRVILSQFFLLIKLNNGQNRLSLSLTKKRERKRYPF